MTHYLMVLISSISWYKLFYGLKQAPRAWYTRLNDFFLFISFRAYKVDTSLFILSDGTNIFYLLVYVDDILLTGNNYNMLHHLIQLLSSKFTLRDLGVVHYFLGIDVQSIGIGLMLCQCCDVAVAQINYPSFKHNTQDSKEQARGRSHEEDSSQIFML